MHNGLYGEVPPKRSTFFRPQVYERVGILLVEVYKMHNGLYGEVPPKRSTFFRPQVYERVGILLVEVYKRVGKSVIWVCERA